MSEKNHIVLRVEGMTCDGCARHVTEALKSAAGIEEAQVGSWKSGQATVIADASVSDESGTGHMDAFNWRMVGGLIAAVGLLSNIVLYYWTKDRPRPLSGRDLGIRSAAAEIAYITSPNILVFLFWHSAAWWVIPLQ